MSTQPKPTPFIWYLGPSRGHLRDRAVYADPGKLAEVAIVRATPSKPHAHAKLVAEAPAMFEALEMLLAELECYCTDYVAAKGPCAFHRAQAVVARIRGEL